MKNVKIQERTVKSNKIAMHSQCPPPIYIDLCINYFH